MSTPADLSPAMPDQRDGARLGDVRRARPGSAREAAAATPAEPAEDLGHGHTIHDDLEAPVPTLDLAAPPTLPDTPLHDDRAERNRRTEEILAELTTTADPARAEELREQLVALTMPVAASIAQRYRSRGIPVEDLRQVAYLALTKAVHRFDPDAGFPLLAFCVPTIRGEIRRYFRDQGWMVRPPRRLQELQQRVLRSQTELSMQLGRPPTEQELAEHLEEPVGDVREALDGRGCFSPASLDRPLSEAEGGSTLSDVLPGESGHGEAAAEARVVLAPVVRRLSPRDRRILQLRFFDGLTQREIADDIGVTQMQVSRLLTRIFRDLRRELGPDAGPHAPEDGRGAAGGDD